MKTVNKIANSLKMACAFLFFCCSIFVYTNTANAFTATCKSCGSEQDCNVGTTNMCYAWTDCEVYQGNCYVYGAYISCDLQICEPWNCYKKVDSKLSQIMQPILVVGLNNLAFPPVFGSPA